MKKIGSPIKFDNPLLTEALGIVRMTSRAYRDVQRFEEIREEILKSKNPKDIRIFGGLSEALTASGVRFYRGL